MSNFGFRKAADMAAAFHNDIVTTLVTGFEGYEVVRS